jgi:hypothetical protein
MVKVNKFCEIGFPRAALTDSHNMFDGDRARQQPQSNQAVNLAHKVQSQGSLLLIYFHPKLERREGVYIIVKFRYSEKATEIWPIVHL